MNLNDLIDKLEEIRGEHGGLIFVETASDGMLMDEESVNLMKVGDEIDGEYVVQIG